MSLSMRWVGPEESVRIGRVRSQCYAPKSAEADEYSKRLAEDDRITGDDLLLAEKNGVAVGTTTSYSFTMWIRGAAVPCQGIAWVGTIKTHRRSGGIATQLMRETINKGRERGQVVSALMPFRASFYEHFGYGLVERRCRWTLPLSVLPHGDIDGFTFVHGADDARRACRQRMVEAGQCDIERLPGSWNHFVAQEGEGYTVADVRAGVTRSWAHFEQEKTPAGKDVLNVFDYACDSPDALRRMLHFFASLRDQYSAVILTLPVDVPLNHLLRESQVPHRIVNHETADTRLYTRMQARVLDHARLLESIRLPIHVRGQFSVAIRESEGEISRLHVEIDNGRAVARPTSGAIDIECTDVRWASMILGDLPATTAARLGLITANNPAALSLLDQYCNGPAPFCTEYF